MNVRVGIPRALLYYRYFPLWKSFFETLGLEMVVSPSTTEEMIRQGSKFLPGDLCLPVKIFFGHVESIKREVDFLFIPRYISVEPNAYMCPKLMGLPDMVLCAMGDLPPLIDLPIHNKAQGMGAERNFYLKVGERFVKNRQHIQQAYLNGMERQRRFREALQKGFSFEEAVHQSEALDRSDATSRKDGRMKLGIIGRPYCLYDPFLSHTVIKQVEERGYQICTTEAASEQEIQKSMERLRKRIYWSYGKEMVGAAIHFGQIENMEGLINLASFGCGQDSFNFELIQHYTRGEVPILSLIFDEPVSKVGFSTRIDAFLEMIARRKSRP